MQLLAPQQSAGKEAAALALALLTTYSANMAHQCSSHPQWQHWLLSLLKHEQPSMRLAACICLQNICSAQAQGTSTPDNTTEVCISALLVLQNGSGTNMLSWYCLQSTLTSLLSMKHVVLLAGNNAPALSASITSAVRLQVCLHCCLPNINTCDANALTLARHLLVVQSSSACCTSQQHMLCTNA